VAICHGWIDGQKLPLDVAFWRQKFTPRGRKSLWSKKNCARVEALSREGRMRPAGLAAAEAAKADGRWDAAYESPQKAGMAPDLAAALAANRIARERFEALSASDKYAVHFRLHTAKKPATRARRLAQFLYNLEHRRPIRATGVDP
jgi:uncharacterized protein YdeI (YjbR/CyaY-like superfamily)